MKHNLLLTTTVAAMVAFYPQAFVNTNAQGKFYISDEAQNSPLTEAEYELINWVEVTSMGNLGETGNNTNLLNYDTWGDDVIQKGKGLTDAGSPTVEVARIANDPGQVLMRAAAAVGNQNNYAFRLVRSDAPIGGTPTIIYNRGLVTGPTSPNGRNEDFDLEVYSLGLIQEQVITQAATA